MCMTVLMSVYVCKNLVHKSMFASVSVDEFMNEYA